MTDGTVRTVTVPLGFGRLLRVARLDLEGREPSLLLNVGFEDTPHPLADPGAIAMPLMLCPSCGRRWSGWRRRRSKMETKVGIGSQTLSIGGVPVQLHPERSGCGACEERKALMRQAERNFARARELLHEDPGVEQPDREAVQLARFAADIGTRLTGGPGVKVLWFDLAAEPDRLGYVRTGWPTIRLRSDLRGQELAEVALHEVQHISQDAAGELDRSDSEATAEHFGKGWAPAVWAAFRWTKGDVRLVHLSARRRPSFRGTYRRGDVVLSTPTARVWAFTPQNLNTWSAIG